MMKKLINKYWKQHSTAETESMVAPYGFDFTEAEKAQAEEERKLEERKVRELKLIPTQMNTYLINEGTENQIRVRAHIKEKYTDNQYWTFEEFTGEYNPNGRYLYERLVTRVVFILSNFDMHTIRIISPTQTPTE